MKTAPLRKELYVIGWGYDNPRSTTIKALLAHPESLWAAAGIVHDEVWLASVDGLPVVKTSDFLADVRARNTPTYVLLQLQEPTQRQIWMRRVRDYGLHLLDEGEILRETADTLRTNGTRCDLGVVQLPDCFDPVATEQLAALPVQNWFDADSVRVFNAYLAFLRSGLLTPFEKVCRQQTENPLPLSPDHLLGHHMVAMGNGVAWEVARQRSNFLEQVCLLGGRRWQYVFSSENAALADQQLQWFQAAMSTLAVDIRASAMAADGSQQAVGGTEILDWHGRPRVVRIDLDAPSAWAEQFAHASGPCALWIALGRSPSQMLHVLERIRGGTWRLRCHRPGPLGLELQWWNTPLPENLL